MKKPLGHVVDYLVLCFFISITIVLTLLLNGNPQLQRLPVISLSLIYIVWGVLHPYKEGALHSKIVWEYILFGLFGAILVIGLY